MGVPSREKFIIGNWKMHKTIEEAVSFVAELVPLVQDCHDQVYLAVPFTAIHPAAEKAKGSRVIIGAQNMNDASEGAFTGEIAARMLIDAGAQFVILGHSERRHYFHETSEFINRKVKKAIKEGLQAIVCVGETSAEHEAGKSQEVVKEQLTATLAGLDERGMHQVMISYEPVWAIGTGDTATPEIAEEMHQFCRKVLAEVVNEAAAEFTQILYGGSVRPENAKQLMEQTDIDGLLVGGASLSLESFVKIVNYCTQKETIS